MTFNVKVVGLMDFLGDFGLRHKSISFSRWHHGSTVIFS